jgi:hypothetical protein
MDTDAIADRFYFVFNNMLLFYWDVLIFHFYTSSAGWTRYVRAAAAIWTASAAS